MPALVVRLLIVLSTYRRYPDICRRILSGLGAGAIATLALDAVRQAGVIHGWLPGDTPAMFGKMATGSNDFAYYYAVGQFVHYLNGANFGLFYAFVWGRRPTNRAVVGWATLWALITELGMMLGPPMGPMVGLFGLRYAWPQLFLLTLVALIAIVYHVVRFGSGWGYPLGVLMFVLILYLTGHVGLSFVLAGILGQPG